MTEDTRQFTADNLRADFMNATTTWARWNVLNRALEWAVAASENADRYRGDLLDLRQHMQNSAAEADERTFSVARDGWTEAESVLPKPTVEITLQIYGSQGTVTDHDPESRGDGAYDQLFEHYDAGNS